MTEEELLIKAAEERAAIVAKYDRGREDGVHIDAWEDPAYEIYHVTDRYGFIHDKRLPQEHDVHEGKQKEVENRRLNKWLKMMKAPQWSKETIDDKFRKRLIKGVPDAIRGAVWLKLLGVIKAKEEQVGKYEEMRHLARLWSPDLRQIDLDVNRTYRDHLMFRERYGTKQQALFHILAAYSVYNSEIGYCQGMSQIAALLLMYLNEEEAFWGLSNLMANRKWAMHGFPKLLRFQQHHDRILQKILPKLKKHFDKQGIDAGLYTLKWFFQCFLDRVPFSLTLRLWDLYLLEGERLLTGMAYTILKLHRRTLSRLGMEEIVEFLQIALSKNFGYSDDATVENLEKSLEELRKLKLDSPGPPPSNELPQRPFGVFSPPSIEASLGRRRAEFSEEEKLARAAVMVRLQSLVEQQHGSHLSIDDNSLDPSIDEVSSVQGVQRSSRSSIAGTSATSAADISTLSAHRLHSNGDEDESIGRNSVISLDPENRVLEKAVIHSNGTDRDLTPPPFPTVPSSPATTLATPVFPAPPPLYKSPSEDRVRIYVPYGGSSEALSLSNGTVTPNGISPPASLTDPNRVVIRVETTETSSMDRKRVKSPSNKIPTSLEVMSSRL